MGQTKIFAHIPQVLIKSKTSHQTSACLPLPTRHLSSQSLLRQATRTLLALKEHPDVAGLRAVSLMLRAIDQSMGGFHLAIASAVALRLFRAMVGLDLRGSRHFRLMMVDLDVLGYVPLGRCSVWIFCFDSGSGLMIEDRQARKTT